MDEVGGGRGKTGVTCWLSPGISEPRRIRCPRAGEDDVSAPKFALSTTFFLAFLKKFIIIFFSA